MESSKILELAFHDVRPDEAQPRRTLDPEHLATIEETWRERGQIKPACVREDKDGGPTPYILVDGECRWRVGKKLHDSDPTNPKYARFRAYVDNLGGNDLLVVQYIANCGKGHTPLEKAQVLQRLISSGVARSKARSQLGVPAKQYRNLKEFLGAPPWLHRYGAPLTINVNVTTNDGRLVLDDTGRPKTTTQTVPPLPLAHLAVLTRFANRLVSWDREQQGAHPAGEHRNVAQSVMCRIADKAVRNSISVARLTKQCAAAVERVIAGEQPQQSSTGHAAPPDTTTRPFTHAADGSLRIATTDPARLSSDDLDALVTELDALLSCLRAARDEVGGTIDISSPSAPHGIRPEASA